MATLAEVYSMRSNADLKNRIAAAAAKQAYWIITTEPLDTPNHAERVTWAKSVMLDPETEANRMMWAVIQNPTIQTGSATDNDVEYVVNVLVDVFAIKAV